MQELSMIDVWKTLGILVLPCDDIIAINNLKISKHDFRLYFVLFRRTPVLSFKPRIEILKFVHTYNHRRVHNCTKKTYVHFAYPTSKMERVSYTASILPLTYFSQTQFMLVEPRIISERSRCFLVIFSASLEKLLENKLVVPRWFSVFPTQTLRFISQYTGLVCITLANSIALNDKLSSPIA